MNRRLNISVVIYNILFLSFLGLLFIITKIYDKEIPSNFYDHTIVEHRYIEILIFFVPIYLEYSLGLCCKFNRGFVIGCEILAFLLLQDIWVSCNHLFHISSALLLAVILLYYLNLYLS